MPRLEKKLVELGYKNDSPVENCYSKRHQLGIVYITLYKGEGLQAQYQMFYKDIPHTMLKEWVNQIENDLEVLKDGTKE